MNRDIPLSSSDTMTQAPHTTVKSVTVKQQNNIIRLQ